MTFMQIIAQLCDLIEDGVKCPFKKLEIGLKYIIGIKFRLRFRRAGVCSTFYELHWKNHVC